MAMATFKLARLANRKLIKITGPDCYPYLQGLLCNDLRYLYEPDRVPKREHAVTSSNVLSTFMLNAQGRVICDMIIYRTPNTRFECKFSAPGEAKESDELLIECDSELADKLATTLHGYRVRRKVALNVTEEQEVWCLFPNLIGNRGNKDDHQTTTSLKPLVSHIFTPACEILENNLTVVCDPRLDLMGMRILSSQSTSYSDLRDVLQSRIDRAMETEESSVKQYILHRHTLGVGEGPDEHVDGNCFPLESNADFLNSVSFNKGCYLGQELTARIHYTGVVRKRLMPTLMRIDKSAPPPALPFAPGSDILDVSTGKKIGVLRHITAGHGLSLMRHDLLNESSTLIHEATNVPLSVWKPYWWNSASPV